jgi:GT2 family glycosyltransferase/lipopolysaccharide/colanic/teichoic acid biosynthesis glycosyltransferase
VSEVSVIIVNYNSENFLPACLESIKEAAPRTDIDVIVVDNSKGGGAGEILRQHFASGTFIENDRNLGYARAVNQGIGASASEFVFVVNPDTVAEEGSLTELVDFMNDHPEAGIVGPKLLNPDGTTQPSCRTFYTLRTIVLRRTFLGKIFRNSASVRHHLMLDWDHDSSVEVDWVMGAAMMVRREAISEVGPMDERFFLYFEDVDWCYRMKAAGWKTFYHAGARLVHHYRRQSADARFGRAKRAHLESWLRFSEKWSLVLYLLKRNRDAVSAFVLFVADLAALSVSFYLAYLLRLSLGFMLTKPTPGFDVYQSFMLVSVVVGIGSMAYVGLYGRRRIIDWIDLLFDVSRAMLLTSIILMASTFLLYVKIYSRAALIMLLPVSIVILTVERLVFRFVLKKLVLTGVNVRRILVVGSGEVAERAKAAVRQDDGEGLELAGFVDTRDWFEGESVDEGLESETVWRVIHAQRASEIIVADSPQHVSAIWPIITGLSGRGVQVSVATELDVLLGEGDKIEEVGGLGLVSLRKRPAPGGLTKRIVELVFTLVASVILLPLAFIGALCLFLAGRRPVFCKRTVSGEYGQAVTVRTLNCDGGSVLDRVLVKAGLCSAPLMLSVLSGQMALVGLRPQELKAGEETEQIPKGKPGVLGMWKLGSNPEDCDCKDSEYLATWSTSLDIKTILRCVLGKRPA